MNYRVQYLLPQQLLTKLADKLANSKLHWLKNSLIRYFVGKYPINMSEAIEEEPLAYPSFNAFFTRALKKGLRPICPHPHSLACPADGAISQFGPIDNGTLIQAKGHDYQVLELLGGDPKLAQPFQNGHFCTVYLAPKDYHRVHLPYEATLLQTTYIPGKLFSVSQHTAENIPNLFAMNERVVCLFETPQHGKMAIILVGAMIVGSIETQWAGTITPPRSGHIQTWQHQSKSPLHFKKGQEIGRFKLGSTVIMLCEKNLVHWKDHLTPGLTVRMGQPIASFGLKEDQISPAFTGNARVSDKVS